MYYSPSTGGFYSVEIHGDSIPRDAVAISPDEHAALMAAQASGKVIEHDATGRPVAVAPMIPLDESKLLAAKQVDQAAEAARLAFVTPGAYQALEYERAAEQAEAYVAGTITESVTLQADVDAGTVDPRTGAAVTTLAEAADLVLFRRAQWVAVLDAIRAVRLKAKADIAAAPDAAAVQAVLDSLTWPTPEAGTLS